MSAYEHAVAWVTERFEGVDPSYRRDVELTTRELTARSGLRARLLELFALVALALRLRSRARTGDRPEQVWHQGVYIGSVVLVLALAAGAWASAERTADALMLIGAAGLTASAVLGMRGNRFAAALLAVAGGAAYIGAGASAVGSGAFATACIAAVAGLIAGTPPPAAGRRTALAIGAVSLAGLPLAVAGAADAAVVAGTLTVVASLVLLALGWFDPRLAAAATALIFTRLLATGLDELGQALAVLTRDGGGLLLLRWILMSTGVVVAWLATNRSIRRTSRL